MATNYPWEELSDEELLKLRICDLKLTIEGSPLEPIIEQLYADLEAKGLKMRPTVYLGDEWFSPEGEVAISAPFYLAHPRLRALEKQFMFEVEGGDPKYCLKLFRHEMGHCFDHLYKFSKKRTWRKVFGHPGEEYDPDQYQPRRYSRSFVRHLDHHYAQSHPDEDFAETFAVWLNPHKDWATEYSKWKGALEKLRYVDKIAKGVLDKDPPPYKKGTLPYRASRLKSTLKRHYDQKRKYRAEDFPDFYDKDLRRIFNGTPELSKREFGAFGFMRRHRKLLVDNVTRWTSCHKYVIHDLVRRLTKRCQEKELTLGRPEKDTAMEVAAYLSHMATNYLHLGTFKKRP